MQSSTSTQLIDHASPSSYPFRFLFGNFHSTFPQSISLLAFFARCFRSGILLAVLKSSGKEPVAQYSRRRIAIELKVNGENILSSNNPIPSGPVAFLVWIVGSGFAILVKVTGLREDFLRRWTNRTTHGDRRWRIISEKISKIDSKFIWWNMSFTTTQIANRCPQTSRRFSIFKQRLLKVFVLQLTVCRVIFNP